MSPRKYYVSMSPHVHNGVRVSTITYQTMLALVPAALAGVYFFGWSALKVIVVCMVVAAATEAGMQRIMGRRIQVDNGHALMVGMLLALMFPPGLPWWAATLGAFVAIVLGKQIFGGLGNNPFNPAVVGWIVTRVSYPAYMKLYYEPLTGGASFGGVLEVVRLPLQVVHEDLSELLSYPWWKLLLGLKAGGIGEVFILGLLAGGLYLLAKRIITWHAPVACLGSAALFCLLFHWIDPETYAGPVFHLMNGGLVLAAFFLVTDRGTTPVTPGGKILVGVIAGSLTMIIRYWGTYADGVYFGVMLANMLTPISDRIRPAVYGRVKEGA